jgi:DNA helicase II / ATP-dependent DNA helicase PcrA
LSDNRAIIAAAGSRKTQTIIDEVLAHPEQRALITTYTLQNQMQIEQRLRGAVGQVPPHVRIAGWFSFLIGDAVSPYQHAVLGEIDQVRGLNFDGEPGRYIKRGTRAYYLDSRNDLYRSSMADFACLANERSGLAVIRRLAALYDHIYIDEAQDLAGYDLDFLELLFASRIRVTMVGDPRQALYSTVMVPKNKKYRGAGLLNWIDERAGVCRREDNAESYRCHQAICDFASQLFPEYPPMKSRNEDFHPHQGLYEITPAEVHDYVQAHRPVVLRYQKRTDTLGHSAINIGVAKGSTFDHVLIFLTKTMRQYLLDKDLEKFKSREHLYVAVTRARHSVALVI